MKAGVAILYPLLVMVALTAMVWVRMYITRVAEIRHQRLRLQDLANAAVAEKALAAVAAPSDNFSNLFEIPVLFYLLVVLVFVTGSSDALYLGGAWAFVLLRVLHSLIHLTSNRVKYRFFAYFSATLLLWVMWARFGWQLLSVA